MICINPTKAGTAVFPCRKCLPCKSIRRAGLVARQILESMAHSDSSFVTLTYNDDHLPPGGSLAPLELTNFIKRLRHYTDVQFRYFAVGEYGDKSWRPHYHLTVFGHGVGTLVRGRGRSVMSFSQAVNAAWGKGFVQVAEFNESTARYVSGYVSKKMTKADDERLGGRYPEFVRRSLKPGLGALMINDVAAVLQQSTNWHEFWRGDVPPQWAIGPRKVPFDAYLLQKFRDAVSMSEDDVQFFKDRAGLERAQEMLDVYAAAKAAAPDDDSITMATAWIAYNRPKAIAAETRLKIFSTPRSL